MVFEKTFQKNAMKRSSIPAFAAYLPLLIHPFSECPFRRIKTIKAPYAKISRSLPSVTKTGITPIGALHSTVVPPSYTSLVLAFFQCLPLGR